ncbi:aminoglycoside phosphotransferase family protein [Paenibacillus herberti]|uniref:Aminoglycoside phosphotransferase n=1 Tax=Paenibacillus herberti TaxID=1619309 RepID=A0A229NSY9_9BACL|nr:aminoglycoside phosphotransferase family protein [Paenibacillus herberti]OXM12984.1 aminoglycoside phosphotransferase [Paenibacillus herberti]
MNSISEIDWKVKSKVVNTLLENRNKLILVPLDSGLEAEVTKVCLEESCFVLKVWNRSSKPNIEQQFKLLKTLYDEGLPVSQPYGWGLDKEANSVLLMSFNGAAVTKINESKLISLAKILTSIHDFPLNCLEDTLFNKHDFINYFYSEIEEHEDIHLLIKQLVDISHMKQDKLIHGDYNLGNILEIEGRYTIIDWTNGQLGDPRYDIAWSIVLISIYVSQRYGDVYRSAFLSRYTKEEIELFEAIACLRWVLLNRIAVLPKGKETIARVQNILKNNVHLNETLI